MRYSHRVSGVPLLLGSILFMIWSVQAFAGSSSSCVRCHLDEDMIEDSLAVAKTVKSAMQSGAG
jgi:hypothetical protein